MFQFLFWVLALYQSPSGGLEMTDRMVPGGFVGNYWGPVATKARQEGKLPQIEITPHMARWDHWGRQVLQDGDIVFRMGDARVLRGIFPMSRFYANASNSKFSHTGIVSWEKEGPVVYDTTGSGVARQPFCVWILDNVGNFGVKRLKPEYRSSIPKVLAYCKAMFKAQPPFDYELGLDDSKLYCVEMTEKAYRSAGLPLSKPVKIGDMERATEFPLCMLGLGLASKYVLDKPLTAETEVYFPGNERHGIWSATQLEVVIPPTFKPGYPLMRDEGLPPMVAESSG